MAKLNGKGMQMALASALVAIPTLIMSLGLIEAFSDVVIFRDINGNSVPAPLMAGLDIDPGFQWVLFGLVLGVLFGLASAMIFGGGRALRAAKRRRR